MIRCLAPALTTFLLAVCHAEPTDPVAGLHGQKLWRKAARQKPVLEGGALREKAIWNDPCVLKEDDNFVMFLTTSLGDPFQPPVLPFRATSKDGTNWKLSPDQPILSPEGTPFVSIETPSVVRFKGEYHLFYSGIYPAGQIPSMAIGHATSKDGISWSHRPRPALKATGTVTDWNGFLVAEPAALVHNDQLYLYFTAMGARLDKTGTKVAKPGQLQSIGLVISKDGKGFGLPKQLLTQGPAYPPSKNFVGYSTPFAFKAGGRVHLIYDVAVQLKGARPEWQQVALHHASSPTGTGAFTEDQQPLLTRNDFSWTSGEILAPSVLLVDNTLHLWFSGHVDYANLPDFINRGFKGPEFGIGHAKAALGEFLGR
jgi:hypothetical protein